MAAWAGLSVRIKTIVACYCQFDLKLLIRQVFCFQSPYGFDKFNMDDPCVCVCVSVSLASNSLETIKIIKLGMIHASHANYTDLDLHSRSYRSSSSKSKCSINSETVEALPIKSAVTTVWIKVYMILASPVTLTVTQGRNRISNWTHFKLVV